MILRCASCRVPATRVWGAAPLDWLRADSGRWVCGVEECFARLALSRILAMLEGA